MEVVVGLDLVVLVLCQELEAGHGVGGTVELADGPRKVEDDDQLGVRLRGVAAELDSTGLHRVAQGGELRTQPLSLPAGGRSGRLWRPRAVLRCRWYRGDPRRAERQQRSRFGHRWACVLHCSKRLRTISSRRPLGRDRTYRRRMS